MKNLKGITLLNYNFKGGVGKTTLTGMEAYLLAHQNKKILLVDFDPQANLTQMMESTYHKKLNPSVSLLDGLDNRNLSHTLTKLSKNIDMLPGDWSLSLWFNKIRYVPNDKRPWILRTLLEPFKKNYDYIFIDVPPTLTDYVLNAIFASDGISIVLQTQKMSFQSALLTAKEIYSLQQQYGLKTKFLGVILYLFHNAKVDRIISKESRDIFGKTIFNNQIKTQERVKGFTFSGIRDKDYWDRKAISMYRLLTNETVYRVRKMISNE